MPSTESSPEERQENLNRFILYLAIIVTGLAALPFLIAWIGTPGGKLYLGTQFNTDDHMVYAAWMRQAMDGQFFFDNRFAVEQQPSLTIHAYFLVIGWVAKLVGIPLASNLARLGFTFLFVMLLGKLIQRSQLNIFTAKFAMILTAFGGGLGFAVWEHFGRLTEKPLAQALSSGRLPIDVWQPEGFVFSSALTNGLFMVSFCLILGIIHCVLDAKDSWKKVPLGFGLMLLLMNIHSYDVLLVAFILIGFLIATISVKGATKDWILRSGVIALGAIPSALWFMHVLGEDKVFQARAATLTYTSNFQTVLIGIFIPFLLSIFGLIKSDVEKNKKLASVGVLILLNIGLYFAASGKPDDAYFLGMGAWGVCLLISLSVPFLVAKKDDHLWNLAWAWASVSTIAPYFPQLFQRKLAMGIIIPWAILGAIGLKELLKPLERNVRNMVSTLIIVITCASSLSWFQREFLLIRSDVSTTSMHPVYFSADVKALVDQLNKEPGRKVVLAMPGVRDPNSPTLSPPYLPDLNAVLSGMTGVYSYAGHWSETPNYDEKRGEATMFFLQNISDDQRAMLMEKIKPDFIVAPNPATFTNLPLADLSGFGSSVFEGDQFSLIKVEN
ncbi:MAG: hypothetical protein KDC26_02505 [Armatimonadetes bacterium]|nr:hypothetical protein [Armatimonadota bacterium]